MAVTTGWNSDGEGRTQSSRGDVTLVDGACFGVSSASGDFHDGTHGLFMLDTRFLSEFTLRVGSGSIEPLSVVPMGPFAATLVGRALDSGEGVDSTVTVIRTRSVGNGLSERIEVHNYEAHPVRLRIELTFDADFAGLFDVKAGHPSPRRRTRRIARSGVVVIDCDDADHDWRTIASFAVTPDHVQAGTARWEAEVAAGQRWTNCVEVALEVGDQRFEIAHPCGTPIEKAVNVLRLDSWRSSVPAIRCDDPVLERSVRQAQDDLGALRIFDPEHADRVVVAAGAPWYMTLFGRDSLIAAWMALLVDQDLAIGVLQSLADLQGEVEDPVTEEQPGRILHEVRSDQETMRTLGGRNAYYGTVDATPLFVMLVGELARWGAPQAVVDDLLPNVDRALRWMDEYGISENNGYIDYRAPSDHGLRNQGWKDSWDGIRYHDGRVAAPPLALAEVQAYAYAAYETRAELATRSGDPTEAAEWAGRARELKRRFNEDFWVDEHGWYAVALDGAGRSVDSLASNVGHCLWTGIIDDDRAAAVAAKLVSREMASGFGLRTLASSTPGFNPLSYHCGSVWPHDTALAIAGLHRYGRSDEAHVLTRGLLDAAEQHGGRLPELFGGFDRRDLATPVRYPAACSPQAWASASPLLLVRAMLGLEPRTADAVLHLAPELPPGLAFLHLDGVPIAGHRVSIEVSGSAVEVGGLPDDFSIATG